MYEPFKFSNYFNQWSPIITQWANTNNVFLFDFDESMYAPNTEQIVEECVEEVAGQYKILAAVESHPFFDTDERYVARIDLITKLAAKYNLQLIFFSADYRLWNEDNKSNRTFIPVWYLRQRYYSKSNHYQSYQFPTNRKYTFSCCNMSNLRFEKVYNYITCYLRDRNDWYLTIYDHPNAAISTVDIRDIGALPEDYIEAWNTKIRNNVPEYKYDLLNSEDLNAHSTIFAGHTDAYCNLVMEHSMEIEIISEKSFKPFIAEQIPVYCAQNGAVQFIEQLGFDTFKDLINHSSYDNIEITKHRSFDNSIARIQAVHKEIDRLYRTNFFERIHQPDIVQRKLKNKEHFYSNTIDQQCLPYLDKLVKR
jgi:hypothetical protein